MMNENFLNRNRGCGDLFLMGCLVPIILVGLFLLVFVIGG